MLAKENSPLPKTLAKEFAWNVVLKYLTKNAQTVMMFKNDSYVCPKYQKTVKYL